MVRIPQQTPLTFLSHTVTHEDVKVENRLMFAQAFSACQVPFELHLFSNGEHGLGLATGHPAAGPWTDLCARWLDHLGKLKRV